QPWKLLASDPEGARSELTLAVNVARVCAAMLEPVVPRFASGLVDQTAAPLPAVTDHKPIEEGSIREPKPLVRRMEDVDVQKLASRFVGEAPTPTRTSITTSAPISTSTPASASSAPTSASSTPTPTSQLSMDQFAAVDLRAGKVLAAERVPK